MQWNLDCYCKELNKQILQNKDPSSTESTGNLIQETGNLDTSDISDK